MSYAAIAVAAGTAVYGGIKAAKAKKEAKRLAANRPELKESPYTRDELQLTKNNLANGMSGAASNAYEQGLDRDLSSSLGAVLQGGGDVNNVAELFDRSQQGRQRLLLMKENLRMNNVNNYVNSLRNSTLEDQTRFKANEYAPWQDQAQAVSQARASGENLMVNGIVSAGSSAAAGIAANQRRNDFNNYFNNPNANSGTMNFASNNGSNLQGSNVNFNNGYSPMANQTPYLNPNYAANPFSSNINENNFAFDNGTQTPTFFQRR